MMDNLEVKVQDMKYTLSVSKGIYKISINKIPFLFFYKDDHAFDMFVWLVNQNIKMISYEDR